MPERNFMDLLSARWAKRRFVCVGLDSDWDRLPGTRDDTWSPRYRGIEDGLFDFNRAIIDATADLACAYKPNLAFYQKWGSLGIGALEKTIKYILSLQPAVPVILDAKYGDIGNTNAGYVDFAFDRPTRRVRKEVDGKLKEVLFRGADAVTIHNYMGSEAMKPFLDCKDKGIIVLCRTSNPGAGQFQDLEVVADNEFEYMPEPLYRRVARHVAGSSWNYNGNCAVVVGATYPAELAEVRKIVGDMPILIPGIGAQGGDLEATVKAGANSYGQGMIINSSRGIVFASKGRDFAEAAREATQELHDSITAVLAA